MTKFLLFPFLWPLSVFLNFLQKVRRYLYTIGSLKSVKLPCFVISVGNFSVGGTGKTPIVIEVAKLFKSKPLAILTRGYKSGLKGGQGLVLIAGEPVLLLEGEKWKPFDPLVDERTSADEAYLQSYKLPTVPVVVGSNRSRNFQLLLSQWSSFSFLGDQPELIILDDGLQHLKIYRDFELVLALGDLSWLQDYPLPLGRLRESANVAVLSDFFLLTKQKKEDQQNIEVIKRMFPNNLVSSSSLVVEGLAKASKRGGVLYFEDCTDMDLTSTRMNLISAIANPSSFSGVVESIGVTIGTHFVFSDHQTLFKRDLDKAIDEGLPLIITEKDFFRQPNLFLDNFSDVFILPIRLPLPTDLMEYLKFRVEQKFLN